MTESIKVLPSEEKAIEQFLYRYFDQSVPDSSHVFSDAEREVYNSILEYVDTRFGSMKYILGLAIDFVILAEQVLSHTAQVGRLDFAEDSDSPTDQFTRVEEKGNRKLNTLTFRTDDGTTFGIRKLEEEVLSLFHEQLYRLDYPSAYVYNTGQWHKYRSLLDMAFSLSESGRFKTVRRLIYFGLQNMERSKSFEGNPRIRLYESVIAEYPRGGYSDENGGVVFQAIAYGYFKADRPHLSLIVDKVRTGSSRQNRIGDIDCYRDVKVEMSIEVKDIDITTPTSYKKELGSFVTSATEDGILGCVFAKSLSCGVMNALEAEGVTWITESDLLNMVQLWDWPKQDAAIRGVLHYLSHIEQNTNAANRLLSFIQEKDPHHDTLLNFSQGN